MPRRTGWAGCPRSVDEAAFLRAAGAHSTMYVAGVADLTLGRPARLLDAVGAPWLTSKPYTRAIDRTRWDAQLIDHSGGDDALPDMFVAFLSKALAGRQH